MYYAVSSVPSLQGGYAGAVNPGVTPSAEPFVYRKLPINLTTSPMSLPDELRRFTTVFGRDGRDIGAVTFTPPTSAIQHDLVTFYTCLRFDQLLIGGELMLSFAPPTKLDRAQNGWRYVVDRDGHQSINEEWKGEWIVIADRNDDAIFYDATSNQSLFNPSADERSSAMLGGRVAYR